MTDNERHAAYGFTAIQAGAGPDQGGDVEADLTTTLTNILHECVISGWDFEGCLEDASARHAAELGD